MLLINKITTTHDLKQLQIVLLLTYQWRRLLLFLFKDIRSHCTFKDYHYQRHLDQLLILTRSKTISVI